jgi:hypothetical protein
MFTGKPIEQAHIHGINFSGALEACQSISLLILSVIHPLILSISLCLFLLSVPLSSRRFIIAPAEGKGETYVNENNAALSLSLSPSPSLSCVRLFTQGLVFANGVREFHTGRDDCDIDDVDVDDEGEDDDASEKGSQRKDWRRAANEGESFSLSQRANPNMN